MPPSTRPSARVWTTRFMREGSGSRFLVPRRLRVERLGRRGGLGEHDLELGLLHLADHASHDDGIAVVMGSMIGQVQKTKLEIVFPEAASSAKALYPQPAWDKKA